MWCIMTPTGSKGPLAVRVRQPFASRTVMPTERMSPARWMMGPRAVTCGTSARTRGSAMVTSLRTHSSGSSRTRLSALRSQKIRAATSSALRAASSVRGAPICASPVRRMRMTVSHSLGVSGPWTSPGVPCSESSP